MRKICVALFLFAFAALLPQAAGALSAFAAGVPDNVATQGLAFGTTYNATTRDEAVTGALTRCRAATDAPANVRAMCRIIAYFDGECLTVAMDPKGGTPGYGWAIGVTADVADSEAMKNCRATAGPDRTAYCKISLSECDTGSSAK